MKAFNLAKACFCRPSELYGIENSYVAYCFDEAVITFGQALENAIEEATEKAKTRQEGKTKATLVLTKWLADSTPTPGGEKQFATPVATKKAR